MPTRSEIQGLATLSDSRGMSFSVGRRPAARLQTRDKNVTDVTKFPFMGGSLSRNRDLLERHADLSPRPHFIRYHETLIIDEIPGHVVGTSQISKSADKCVVRKFGVVR